MKQIAQNYKSGELALLDVPVPACRAGGVLVKTSCSLISAGTEKMKVEESKLSLAGKARARPDQVRKVLDTVASQGVSATYRKVMTRLDSYTPLGYSLSGVVVDVGEGVDDLTPKQRVACAGNKYALHAEFNWIPRNLCAPIPDGVEDRQAAFTTVGAIALQAFRQSGLRLGESALVIGLGLLGQLLVQIIRAAGGRAVGTDLAADRCLRAVGNGAHVAAPATPGDSVVLQQAVIDLTHGAGFDHVFLAASTKSRDPVLLAAELARDRARIVDVGKCNLDLPWNAYYEKELELRFSRSYGPGRYDANYEEQGIDYPIGYVRWTENRNMQAFLQMLAEGKLNLDALTDHTMPFSSAVETYEKLHSGKLDGIGILFDYDSPDAPLEQQDPGVSRISTDRKTAERSSSDRMRIGAIGCGNYASSMLFPHLARDQRVDLAAVATQSSLSAANAARRFGFGDVSTSTESILSESSIDAVVISTRHDSHASLVCDALRAGKTVFVEKPLATNEDQLEAIEQTIAETGNNRLMVGFNRRFSVPLNTLKSWWGPRFDPVMFQYVVNAGRLEESSWYKAADQGSRFIGEGCHFVDLASWWLEQEPANVAAISTPNDVDNISVSIGYPDGSVASIAYLTQGDTSYPKETLTVFGDDKVASCDNFKRITLWEGRRRKTKRSGYGVDKGQQAELAAFVDAATKGLPMPIPLETIVNTTRVTFAVDQARRKGSRQELIRPGISGDAMIDVAPMERR